MRIKLQTVSKGPLLGSNFTLSQIRDRNQIKNTNANWKFLKHNLLHVPKPVIPFKDSCMVQQLKLYTHKLGLLNKYIRKKERFAENKKGKDR